MNPKRLGAVGADAFLDSRRVCLRPRHRRCKTPITNIPFVVEAWAESLDDDARDFSRSSTSNRTPVVGEIDARRDKKDIDVFGCGLRHTVAETTKDAQFELHLNIITPFMPIASDGKAPDFKPFLSRSAMRSRKGRAQGASSQVARHDTEGALFSTISMRSSPRSAATVSTASTRVSCSMGLRPIVMQEFDKELMISNFTKIITEYEEDYGEIEGMYREPRGSITHPHRDETITLGTLMVEEYERPEWTFNKLVYIEKEGANEALKAATTWSPSAKTLGFISPNKPISVIFGNSRTVIPINSQTGRADFRHPAFRLASRRSVRNGIACVIVSVKSLSATRRSI